MAALALWNELKREVKKDGDVGMLADKMIRWPRWLQNHLR